MAKIYSVEATWAWGLSNTNGFSKDHEDLNWIVSESRIHGFRKNDLQEVPTSSWLDKPTVPHILR
jgi:hypothetical protein